MSQHIEKLFYDDIREKKRTGRGAFSKTGKGVKHTMRGALKTPYHYMKNRERAKLNGKVESFNMYEKIISREELEQLPIETQKAMVTYWRENYNLSKIQKEMPISSQTFYDKVVNRLELPKGLTGKKGGTRTSKKKIVAPPIQIESVKVDNNKTDNNKLELGQPQQPQQPTKLLINGLHLEYNGDYDAEALSKIFTKLQLLTDGEECNYKLNLVLSEK